MNYQWLYEAKQLYREQAEVDDTMQNAIVSYIVSEMQGDFNQYVRKQGFDEVTYSEDEGGVRFIYLKPFTLTLEESIDETVERFDNQITRDQIANVIEETSEITPQKKKDERGRLIGFWLDLVTIAPEFYQGEKFYVDVFADLSGEGAVEYGIDDPAEIYQVALGK